MLKKPSNEIAQEYVNSGDYYWNSGMFLFRASRYLEELKKYCPNIFDACQMALEGAKTDLDFMRINNDRFAECPAKSVDYAVMEKTADAVVVPMNAGWSDIGSWTSLWNVSKKDEQGNVSHGDVLMHNTNNSFVRTDDKLVTTIGVNDLVIILY